MLEVRKYFDGSLYGELSFKRHIVGIKGLIWSLRHNMAIPNVDRYLQKFWILSKKMHLYKLLNRGGLLCPFKMRNYCMHQVLVNQGKSQSIRMVDSMQLEIGEIQW